jgi:hypothetical protein
MATVDAQFSSLMDDMTDFSTKISDYLISDGSTQREWMIPDAAGGGWTFDPTDIPNIGDPFDRSGPNATYAAEYSGSGSPDNEIRTVMGTHVEINYMGMMERAFRERHRTVVRAQYLLAGRRKAHGDTSYGVHKASVQGYVTELFTA